MNSINSPEVLEYLKSLRSKPDKLITEMESFAKDNKIPILDWKAAEFIEQLILVKNPKRVLEIGTAIAYTTIRIAHCLSTGSVIDTIELSKHNIPLAKNNIVKVGLEKKINIIEGDAKKIIPTLNREYDFVFLDADKEDYLDYYEQILPLLTSGGVLIIDNLLWKGNVYSREVNSDYKPSTEIIKKMNEFILNDSRVNTTILPFGDGLGFCIKK
jgi:predicted O-methyltransferase YrrM